MVFIGSVMLSPLSVFYHSRCHVSLRVLPFWKNGDVHASALMRSSLLHRA